ncbi:MAG TPA: hypothetical protein VFH73_20830 [Polyangia bacterium]|jgi:hypothetical protein|nr:hypothetical protein [Polyangia bacterium]
MTTQAPVTRRAFVDAVESDGGSAVLLFGEEVFSLPVGLLPPDAREGSWVELTIVTIPAPDDGAEDLRRTLGRDDPGGDIKL